MTTPLTWIDDWVVMEHTIEAIPLDPELLDLSHLPARERWAYRLQHLAIQGFGRWLQEREPSFPLKGLDSTAAPAASLQVGSFRVCLLPTRLTDDEIGRAHV